MKFNVTVGDAYKIAKEQTSSAEDNNLTLEQRHKTMLDKLESNK